MRWWAPSGQKCHEPHKPRNQSRGGRPNHRRKHRAKVADSHDDADERFVFMGEVTAHIAGKDKCDELFRSLRRLGECQESLDGFTDYERLDAPTLSQSGLLSTLRPQGRCRLHRLSQRDTLGE